jgi:predicted amidohydrolase
MKVSLIQMDMLLGDPQYNFKHAEELVCSAAKDRPDVICFPETWNVGSFPKENLSALCDIDGQNVRNQFGALAREFNINIIAGSIANVKNDKIYNTTLIFDRTGEYIAEYDKTHLFSPLEEDVYFEAGNQVVTFDLDGVLCGIIICYDLRFPELIRTLALKGIQVLFIPSQWPFIRINHWNVLCEARAIENQMFVVACNSVGKAGNIQFGGSSSIVDPWGEVIARGGGNEEIVTAELDLNIIENIRISINVFKDRKPHIYKIN